jgi:Protein of unknown function with HXXEE motif
MRDRPHGLVAARWLFPVTFAVHLLEEFSLAAEWFGAWSERTLGMAIGHREFLVWNAVAFVLMCAGAALTNAHQKLRWIEVAMSIAVLGNAVFHVAASAATWTYSPGLVTGLLLWVPLGLVRLPIAFRESSQRGRRIGISVGVSAVVIPLAVLASG